MAVSTAIVAGVTLLALALASALLGHILLSEPLNTVIRTPPRKEGSDMPTSRTAADRGTDQLHRHGLAGFLAPSQVAVFGDWHGDTWWATGAIDQVTANSEVRLLLHVGDFGIWPGSAGRRYLHAVSEALVRIGAAMLVTPGNHEDWSRLSEEFADAPGEPLPLAERLWALPRGFRFRVGEWQIGSLGGAPSVDRDHRSEGVNWWPDEQITEADVEAFVADGPVDVLIAHDAPAGGTEAVSEILATNPFGFSGDALAYAAHGRELMTRVWQQTQPRLLVHGHYHVAGDTGEGEHRVVSLSQERTAANIALVDLTGSPDPETRVSPAVVQGGARPRH